jgi:hypothetical protein
MEDDKCIILHKFAEDWSTSYLMIGSDRSMSVATDKEIEVGAKAIARDLSLPGGGRKKLARVVEDHLSWFAMVEARGLTWADITRLLSVAGAMGQNGRAISIGTLSSTVWRKREDIRHKSNSDAVSFNPATTIQSSAPHQAGRRGQRSRNSGEIAAPRDSGLLVPSFPKREPERPSKDTGSKQARTPIKRPPLQSGSKGSLQKSFSNNDLLAFMQRSTSVRKVKREK